MRQIRDAASPHRRAVAGRSSLARVRRSGVTTTISRSSHCGHSAVMIPACDYRAPAKDATFGSEAYHAVRRRLHLRWPHHQLQTRSRPPRTSATSASFLSSAPLRMILRLKRSSGRSSTRLAWQRARRASDSCRRIARFALVARAASYATSAVGRSALETSSPRSPAGPAVRRVAARHWPLRLPRE